MQLKLFNYFILILFSFHKICDQNHMGKRTVKVKRLNYATSKKHTERKIPNEL